MHIIKYTKKAANDYLFDLNVDNCFNNQAEEFHHYKIVNQFIDEDRFDEIILS